MNDDRPAEYSDRRGRALWLLLPGFRPVLAESVPRAIGANATHYCYEGDQKWRPIAELDAKGEHP